MILVYAFSLGGFLILYFGSFAFMRKPLLGKQNTLIGLTAIALVLAIRLRLGSEDFTLAVASILNGVAILWSAVSLLRGGRGPHPSSLTR